MAATIESPYDGSSSRRWSYDVFLSFRGEDNRFNFTDHLYHALTDAGINVFRDDEELHRGEDIGSSLIDAIEESRIFLVVFSRNYASSRWCLNELEEIMNRKDRMAVPIFYNIDPSHVRNQRGPFEDAFSTHKERGVTAEKLQKWSEALTRAGNLSGWDSRGRPEAVLIEEIVEEVLVHLNRVYLNVAIHPVGINSRVQALDSSILVHTKDRVRIIGICGMGGLGKTSLAKAVFNQFFHGFKGKSFLANIREISKQPDGLLRLQEQLLSDSLRRKKVNISSVDMGINVIKERLCNKRVLVVLDDVDHLDQLHALGVKLTSAEAREGDWGLGSRIIITTRDRHLLENIEVDSLHDIGELSDDESLELFSWHAFKRSRPEEDYDELSKDVVSYSKGLPLALEVLGSHLSNKKIPAWRSALEKLKRIPNGDIQKKLRISFDALSDDTEKDMFLDIACFFIGMDKDDVVKILDGCKFYAEDGIIVLLSRCLMKVNEYNKLAMHDLLRDMGRGIVREESPKDPGKSSRLWCCDDVLSVLRKQTGTDAVEGLVLKRPTMNKLRAEAFAKMQGLRLLQVSYVQLKGDYGNLSKELRWLFWHGFPLEFIPNGLHLENLIAIDMRYSKMIQLWKGIKFLERLKVLKLSHSHNLLRTPDFSQVPNLEKLVLKDCTSLVEVDPSIGCLDLLRMLNLRDCKRLEVLPNSICRLRSLKILNLSGCSKFEKLPDDLGMVESLTELLMDGTLIKEDKQVPRSIVRLKNLKKFQKCGFQGSPSSFCNSLFLSWESPRKSLDPFGVSTISYSSSKELTLYNCKSPNEATMKDISLSSLVSMGIGSNNVFSIPASSSSLPNLNSLRLDHYMRLQSMPDLPEGLMIENADHCTPVVSHQLNQVLGYLHQSYTKPLIEKQSRQFTIEELSPVAVVDPVFNGNYSGSYSSQPKNQLVVSSFFNSSNEGDIAPCLPGMSRLEALGYKLPELVPKQPVPSAPLAARKALKSKKLSETMSFAPPASVLLYTDSTRSFHSTPTSTHDIWRPICSSSPGPVHEDDSSLEDRTTAMEIARGIVLPRDDQVLTNLSDDGLSVVNTIIDVVEKLEAKAKDVENLKEQLQKAYAEMNSSKVEMELGKIEVKKLQEELAQQATSYKGALELLGRSLSESKGAQANLESQLVEEKRLRETTFAEFEAKKKESMDALYEHLVAQLHDQVARARQLGYEEGQAATMTKMELEEVAEEPVREERAVKIFRRWHVGRRLLFGCLFLVLGIWMYQLPR